MELHVLAVSEYRHEQSSRSGNCHRDVDIVSPNDFLAVNDRVDNGVLLESQGGCLQEERHEAKFNVVFLEEILTEFLY